MFSTDRLDALRERNRDFMNQLWQQREKLEWSGFSQRRKREREDEAKERRKPTEVLTLTLTNGDRGPARASPEKPILRFADTHETQTELQHAISRPSLISKYGGGNAQHQELVDIFRDGNRHPQMQQLRNLTSSNKSCLINHSKEQTEVRVKGRVTFQSDVSMHAPIQSDECEKVPASGRHHLQPLLGYDWIAGVLDAEDSLMERSDEFFNDLHMFRSLNKDECVHSPQAEFSEQNHSGPALLTDKDDPKSEVDVHHCTFSYRINSRLFPIPLHSQEQCPVCKKHKSSHPHTTAEPALIRVSIPCSTVLPPYKYKAHRRCSFDPSDSFGLPSHCLSGWLNTGQGTLHAPSSLDLRSSLNLKSSTGSQNKEVEDLSVLKVYGNQISDQISDLPRLAHHNFRHFPPKRKLGRSPSDHVC